MYAPTSFGFVAHLKTRVFASSQNSPRATDSSPSQSAFVFDVPCALKPAIHFATSVTSTQKNILGAAPASGPGGVMSSGGSCETIASLVISWKGSEAITGPNLAKSSEYIAIA